MGQMRKNAEPPAPSASSQVVAAEAPRATEARWIARVKRAEGTTLAAGSPCTIDATIEAQPASTQSSKGSSSPAMGSQALFEQRLALNGMAMGGNDARERLGPKDDKSRFTLQYTDTGTRTGDRSQIDLDSNKGMALVFSDNLPPFKVELAIPIESEPASPLNGKGQRLSRTGTVDGVNGAAGVKVGDKCTVRALPTGQQQSCVAEVKCGAKVLVAPTAPVSCTYHGSQIDSVSGGESPSLAVADDGTKVSVPGDHGYEVRIGYDKN